MHAVPVTVITPNEDELRAMHAALVKSHGARYAYDNDPQKKSGIRQEGNGVGCIDSDSDSDLDVCALAKDMVVNGWVTDAVIITQGSRGVTWVAKNMHKQTHGQTQTDSSKNVHMDDVAIGTLPARALEARDIVNTTGAGDTFAGVFAYSWLWGSDLETCVSFGQEAAVMTLMSGRAVAAELSDTDDD